MKAYYAKQDAEKSAVSEDSMKNSALVKSGADALKKSANALNNDKLWEKKEDYDWDAITKAVKSFVRLRIRWLRKPIVLQTQPREPVVLIRAMVHILTHWLSLFPVRWMRKCKK